jgi:hypothetical protein
MKAEALNFSIDQLKQKIKAFETETTSMKSEVNRLRKEMSIISLYFRKLRI